MSLHATSPSFDTPGTRARVTAGLRQEIGPLLRLAGPVVAAELGWMTMGIVDTMLVGRVGTEAIGAVSVGSLIYFTFATAGLGMLLGLDFLVARAFGAGRLGDAHRALVDGIYLSLALATALTASLLAFVPWLGALGIQESVRVLAVPYLRALAWSVLPVLLYSTFRCYLQALGVVVPIMMTLVSANVVNAVAAWALIFGRLGLPAMGAEGAGWATFASRVYMFLALLAYALTREWRRPTGLFQMTFLPDLAGIGRLVRLGIPATLQRLLEIGVFACATLLAANLDPTALAAHQLALTSASFMFMVPLGVSIAGAVRVGQAVGRADAPAASRAGWTALLVGGVFMLAAGATFVLVPEIILRAFTNEPAVVKMGVSLLAVAAVFQLFDGVQVVATGALRGTGDTRTPMVANLIGHWVLGLPAGYALCFWAGHGVAGLWIGLSIGLIAVAVALTDLWRRRSRALAAELAG